MRKILSILLLLAALGPAQADDLRLSIYAYTHHFSPGDYNDHHPMLQLEYRRTWIGGVFLNSGDRWSWYGAYRMTEPWRDRLFAEIGAATGYHGHPIRTVRFGLEVNKHVDVVVLPGFEHAHSLKISQPISVVATIIKF